MSKSKKSRNEENKSTPETTAGAKRIQELKKKQGKFIASLKSALPIIVLLVSLIALDQFAMATGGLSFALLYQFAFNGKASGRMDGNVLMRNGRGRGFVVPSLVQNIYTTAVRGLFAILSQAWSGVLTNSDRASWNSMTWFFRSDRFGVPKMVKGKAAYVALNANLFNIGGAPIATAPPDAGAIVPAADKQFTADQSTPAMEVAFTAPPDTDTTELYFATPVMPAGVSRPKASAFRMIPFTLDSTGVTPESIQSAYESKYGTAWRTDAANAAHKIFIKVKPINNISGAEGGNEVFSIIITP